MYFVNSIYINKNNNKCIIKVINIINKVEELYKGDERGKRIIEIISK
jgi:hypothetical protein